MMSAAALLINLTCSLLLSHPSAGAVRLMSAANRFRSPHRVSGGLSINYLLSPSAGSVTLLGCMLACHGQAISGPPRLFAFYFSRT